MARGRTRRSKPAEAVAAAPSEPEADDKNENVNGADRTTSNSSSEEVSSEMVKSLRDLLETLSRPEDLLTNLLVPGEDGVAEKSTAGMLRSVSKTLFARLEQLASLEEKLKNTNEIAELGGIASKTDDGSGVSDENDAPLSGLVQLYTGDEASQDEESAVVADAETIWGQIDLQNDALLPRIKKSVKALSKTIVKEGAASVRLLDFGGLNDDKEGDSEGDENTASTSGSDNDIGSTGSDDVNDDEEDEEAKRIRERMERAMTDMDNDDDSNEENEGKGRSKGINSKKANSGSADEEEEDDFIDPIAEEMRDGFFDLNEMEAFADEEEDMLPQQDLEQKPKKKKKSGKLPHHRQRNGEESGSDDESGEEEQEMTKRKKYRDDDEIDALYNLYEKPDSEAEDEEDDMINMTAADFFGKPNMPYVRTKHGQDAGRKEGKEKKFKKSSIEKIAIPDEEADSWDEHSFEDNSKEDDGGPGWREERSDDDNVDHKEDDESSDDEDADNSENVKKKEEEPVSQSSHAEASKKLLLQTKLLEKEMLAEKPWRMTGEAKGEQRPKNSLLKSTPDFEVATKMAPIITVEHTQSIEEIIKKRILEEDWDDVVPRELPDIGLGKRKGELPEVSQEKSKLGLGELYEREYLKKVEGYDKDALERETKEDKAKNEMKSLFANLCSKLDALSNYHFAPRPVADEAEVRSVTTPAIAMEEALPLHVSDARGVAPEELYNPKQGREAVLRGESEMDQTDRKRLRNAKKSARRKARKGKLADEKLISKLQGGLGLNNPYEKRKLREELQMARASGKVTQGEIDTNSDYTTSTKFFQRMQENVEQEIQGGGDADRKRKRKNGMEGSRKSSEFKL